MAHQTGGSTSKKRKREAPQKPIHRKKSKRNEETINELKQRVDDLDSTASFNGFSELPLSRATQDGLRDAHFNDLTQIQQKAVPIALKGQDILGAAKTGSGKTLAFLVPMLENLFRKQWSGEDGLGALIISPTRELAIQIFEVLRKIGKYHTFSAGLVVGGKDLAEERDRMERLNILVCTPGRILQHLDQTSHFDTTNLQMLVLDEADRLLDMGFKASLDAIILHLLPSAQRQTCLFSATQTRSVSDLARLSLSNPGYIAVHEKSSAATPAKLRQNYAIVKLQDKLSTLYSFLRANLKAKILVFVSSGKQVRHIYESFRQLQIGIPLLHLHGRQKQTARLQITQKFSNAQYSCLFATDIVARGLDFPAVDWVVQLDCPEDADTYVHRVGRTARYEKEGKAILFMLPSEEKMLERLERKRVPVEKIGVRGNKMVDVGGMLMKLAFKDGNVKYLAQKAFVSYVKSVHLMSDKEVFKLKELPLEEYAKGMGLAGSPRVKFMKGEDAKERKNRPRALQMSDGEDEEKYESLQGDKGTEKGVRTKYDRMFQRQNQDVLTDHFKGLVDAQPDLGADGAELLDVKRRIPALDKADFDNPPAKGKNTIPGTNLVVDSNRRAKLLSSKKALLKYKPLGTKTVFDDEGVAHPLYELEDEAQFKARGDAESQRREFVEDQAGEMGERDIEDRGAAREKRREKIAKRKAREREADGDQAMAVLASADDDVGSGGFEEYEQAPQLVKREGEGTKWFQNDKIGGEDRRRKSVRFEEADEIDELERMAGELLG